MAKVISKNIKTLYFAKDKLSGVVNLREMKDGRVIAAKRPLKKVGKTNKNILAIHKKIWPKYFELVKANKKRFELRLADFKVKKGDVLILEEWNPKTKKYTGRKIEKQVDYVLKFKLDDFGQKKEIEKKGLYVMQFKQ